MNIWVVLSTVLAGILYFPLCYQILQKKTTQNLWTWLMWGLLDTITLLSLVFQGGNYFLVMIYVGGCTATIFSIIRTRNDSKWSHSETTIALLVLGCVIVWMISGPKTATIAATMAIVIASIPQAIEAWKKPHDNPLFAYAGMTIANTLSTIGGEDWSVKERFFPGVCTVLCLVIAAFIARKFWLPKPALVVD